MKGNKVYKVIISGGGTGGHIYPAIAIANQLQNTLPAVEILFVGAEGRMEMEKVPKAGYEIIGLPVAGIQRRLTWKNLLVPFKLIQSLLRAKKIIKDFQPDVVIGVGGYASAPVLRMAVGQGKPTLIQEQNSYAGLTNKWLANKVNKICVAYPNMETYFPKDKIVFTGNPVRQDILSIDDKRKKAREHFGLEDKTTILVIGGSLGALTINKGILEYSSFFMENNVQVLWQTGKHYHSQAKDFKKESNATHLHVYEFIYEMDLAYAVADIVISRAGALSISELCLVKKPSILIPSPNVSEDHQTKNAMALVNEDAALLVKDTETSQKLGEAVEKLLFDEELKQKCIHNIEKLGKPNADKEIVAEVLKLVD
ncbi:MAG: undecaprenyldiphospho-muramoylpentapeptide beta-N-acetylglucosaminyltransferase [Cytophagales bacterium]|nr:undecaprenyldiphospho-muramoylpentapeptide beta-N-acetylglucosaminyltransferase [Cytophagales bacterium]